ncbi:hypothetical protein CHELA20_40203 [Hyphomicrobiales bacterium]|nr:hypothetical protein CHELA20_40203 [Hyphomicrobiales bacterium]CAH1686883.1 hypothetical protein CHELA41_30032 [Hyphomicrobiales bacterium]
MFGMRGVPLALSRSPRGRGAGLCLHPMNKLVESPPRQALSSLTLRERLTRTSEEPHRNRR